MKGKKRDNGLGTCRECAHSYDPHELTAYEPRVPFMCRCQHDTTRSYFLDHQCETGHYKPKQ